jgi:hypothetical protein
MEGMVSSLNAAAAGTVMLYEALRQRRRDVAPAQTRTPRPEQPAEAPANGGWENEPQQAPEDRSEPAEAPEGGTDETDQVAPAAEIEALPAEVPPVAEKPKRKAPAKRRSTKKSAEEKPEADDASS